MFASLHHVGCFSLLCFHPSCQKKSMMAWLIPYFKYIIHGLTQDIVHVHGRTAFYGEYQEIQNNLILISKISYTTSKSLIAWKEIPSPKGAKSIHCGCFYVQYYLFFIAGGILKSGTVGEPTWKRTSGFTYWFCSNCAPRPGLKLTKSEHLTFWVEIEVQLYHT